MIEKNDFIIGCLKNIIAQTSALLNLYQNEDSIHFVYMLEKLKRADLDLRAVIKIAESKKNEE